MSDVRNNYPLEITKIDSTVLESPVYGTIRFDAEHGYEVLLGSLVDLSTGKIVKVKHPTRTPENRIYVDSPASIVAVEVEASTASGVHTCRMADDHKVGLEWTKGQDALLARVQEDGSMLRFIQRNGTAKCPICVRKDSWVGAQKRKATEAAAKAEEDAAARVAEAAAPKAKPAKKATAAA